MHIGIRKAKRSQLKKARRKEGSKDLQQTKRPWPGKKVGDAKLVLAKRRGGKKKRKKVMTAREKKRMGGGKRINTSRACRQIENGKHPIKGRKEEGGNVPNMRKEIKGGVASNRRLFRSGCAAIKKARVHQLISDG